MRQSQQLIARPAEAAQESESLRALDLPGKPTTIYDLLSHRASVDPDAPAFFSRTERGDWAPTSWSEYLSATETLAKSLFAAGLRTGDVIAIRMPVGPEWEILSMASWRIGAVVLGLDPASSPQAISSIMEESNCRVLVLGDSSQLDSLALDQVKLKFVIAMKGVSESIFSPVKVHLFDSLRHPLESSHIREAEEIPHLTEDNAPAIIVYTSGTTGSSKAIVYNHCQVLLAVESILGIIPLDQTDVSLCWLPLSALFQRMVNLISLASGARLYFIDDPKEMVRQLPDIKPTFLFGVPRFYEKLHSQIEASIERSRGLKRFVTRFALRHLTKTSTETLSWPFAHRLIEVADQLVFRKIREVFGGKVRFMLSGSAPISVGVANWFGGIGLPILECYGLSENIIPMAMNALDSNRIGSVGKPLSANLIHLSDDGEVLVRSAGVFSGYQNESQASTLFTEDGFYRTGDFGRFDADGFLYLAGRQSDFVKTSTGRKLPLIHIETEYKRIPYIEDLVVIGEGRPFAIALLSINADWLMQQSNKQRSEVGILSAEVRELIRSDIASVGDSLAAYERLAGFAVIKQAFSPSHGELTNNGKVRRSYIEDHYRRLIERIYHLLATDTTQVEFIDSDQCHFIGLQRRDSVPRS